jgi:thiol:disulfide interchange protein DsbD
MMGSFLNGALVTIIATPCTAPFMGSAIGFALSQPAGVAIAIFTLLGVGLALPYLVLSLNPSLIQALPKPGRWMETVKQVLGFPMLASSLWLIWVLFIQAGESGLFTVLWGGLILGATLWWYGKALFAQSKWRWVALAVSLMVTIAVAYWVSVPSVSQGGWNDYSPDAVTAALQNGDAVFIDFSAAWCLTCQVNERTVLNQASVIAEFDRHQVKRFRADWTDRNPIITDALAKLGRSGVPVYVYYPPGSVKPQLLPELLTAGIVINAIRH